MVEAGEVESPSRLFPNVLTVMLSHSVQLLFIKSLIQRSISANFLRTMLKHLSNKIREKVLSGKWPAETAAEFQMLKDFRASKMSVKKFLKKNWN